MIILEVNPDFVVPNHINSNVSTFENYQAHPSGDKFLKIL